jgi:hypothetical protein
MTSKLPDRIIPRRSGKKRALFDTNIWRYVVDNGSQGSLLQLARDGSYDVQIAPSVVYETLRLKDASLRDTLVRFMTNPRFHRLMPEAYSESFDILQEINRVRPDWLRNAPDYRFYNRLKNDWTRKMGGFWVRCVRDPESEARFHSQVEVEMIEGAKKEYQLARKQMISSDWKYNPPMDKTLGSLPEPVPGWNGEWVEVWRIERLASFTYGLARRGNAYRDWIAPFVELDDSLLHSAGWVEFWLHLTETRAMPREWIRWAHSFAQRFRKVSSGSPGDTQLFAYFLDTDCVITADKALLEILDECRPYAPCRLPDGKLIPAGAPGVANLVRLLET